MATDERLIYHFTEQDTFERSKSAGSYKPTAFAKDGFIHCSTREQVLQIANGIAPRDTPLVLLEVETSKVRHEIIYENLEGGERLFPHIYGGIPHDAISRIWEFRADHNGRFNWPEEEDRSA
ncbi:MAG TPA: DUF952 domain-containing protein [Candidatus Kapabacteria bacterium]|nr:DUF952 domain-containing protein [Candidatus Kapabacteria bacterium]